MARGVDILPIVAIRALGALVVEGGPRRLDAIVEAISRDATWRPVLRAADGAAALGLLDAFIPGLLVLDLETPEARGLQVLHRVRRDRRFRYTAVVVTGTEEVADEKERGDWLPGEVWLPRPFQLDDLDTAIRLSRLISEYEGRYSRVVTPVEPRDALAGQPPAEAPTG
jgi:DNA-binding response OmpR family regulator